MCQERLARDGTGEATARVQDLPNPCEGGFGSREFDDHSQPRFLTVSSREVRGRRGSASGGCPLTWRMRLGRVNLVHLHGEVARTDRPPAARLEA